MRLSVEREAVVIIDSSFHTNLIRDKAKAKQLVDFSGLALEDGIYPTDIDGLIEYHNSLYIIFEIKYKIPFVSIGQRIALERLAHDLSVAGKEAVVFVATHDVTDPKEDVDAAECVVRKFYDTQSGRWFELTKKPLTLSEAIRSFKAHPGYFHRKADKYLN